MPLLGLGAGFPAPAGGGPALPNASTAAVVSPQTVVPFYNLGVLIALFSPRCSDSLASVRQHAVDCVYCLLYIQLCYEGGRVGRGRGPQPLMGGTCECRSLQGGRQRGGGRMGEGLVFVWVLKALGDAGAQLEQVPEPNSAWVSSSRRERSVLSLRCCERRHGGEAEPVRCRGGFGSVLCLRAACPCRAAPLRLGSSLGSSAPPWKPSQLQAKPSALQRFGCKSRGRLRTERCL